MRVLICGSRTFGDVVPVWTMLEGLYAMYSGQLVVVTGMAEGADLAAYNYAVANDIAHEDFPADWTVYPDTPLHLIGRRRDGSKYNRAAGPERNRRMLAAALEATGGLQLCVAFTDKPLEESRGTLDMVTISEEAGVPVWRVECLPLD